MASPMDSDGILVRSRSMIRSAGLPGVSNLSPLVEGRSPLVEGRVSADREDERETPNEDCCQQCDSRTPASKLCTSKNTFPDEVPHC
jgi:hypothetical protein